MKISQCWFEILNSRGLKKDLKPGVFLWQEGDPSSEVVLLLEGSLEVVKQNPDGREIVLRSTGPGNILGEMAALEGKPHSASVRARTLCRILTVSKERFCSFVREEPSVFEALFTQEAERVRNLTQQVHELGIDPILKRVAKKILEESLEQKRADLRMTHQELADRIGGTRESVTKSLGVFVRQGWIRLSRGEIFILKEEELRNLSK
ncbi:MAG: Crp/Fnr family transcriptional regulator [Candidatus Eremiobacteraeota bacterium]|nr:Crp/Fnr family transcriptional regulator [Candidatus Eremiobacteraeota bacterium]MCL5055655.1 Crp/Fnr family transcriptional regulator [Bacillota bacterium]